MQKPSLGRIVLAMCPQARSNGADVAPAVITRVWSERPDGGWTINATVLPDAAAPAPATSLRLFEDEAAARASAPEGGSPYAAFWPPRVG